MECKHCGAEFKDAKFCPECGKPVNGESQTKKELKIFLSIFVVLLVTVFPLMYLLGAFDDPEPTSNYIITDAFPEGGTGDTASTTSSAIPFKLTASSLVEEKYATYIIGTAVNDSGLDISYASVEINLYRGSTLVGSTYDNIANWKAGETWSFKAYVYEDGITDYAIVDITGY